MTGWGTTAYNSRKNDAPRLTWQEKGQRLPLKLNSFAHWPLVYV